MNYINEVGDLAHFRFILVLFLTHTFPFYFSSTKLKIKITFSSGFKYTCRLLNWILYCHVHCQLSPFLLLLLLTIGTVVIYMHVFYFMLFLFQTTWINISKYKKFINHFQKLLNDIIFLIKWLVYNRQTFLDLYRRLWFVMCMISIYFHLFRSFLK